MTSFEGLQTTHHDFYSQIETKLQLERTETQRTMSNKKKGAKEERVKKVQGIVETIQEEEIIDSAVQAEHVRKYLCKTLTPVVSEGILKIVEIHPKDPVDFLVDSL